KAFARGGVDDQLQLMSRGQGTFIMTASTGIEVAVEKEDDEYGLFTKHLVQGIRSGEADKDGDGLVDMQELYEYVHEKVGEEGAQEPMKWDLHAKGKLVIARSVKKSRERRKQEIRKKLYGLAASGVLTDSIVYEAINVILKPEKDRTEREKQCGLLVEQLVNDKISSADFIEIWVKTCLAGEQEERKKTSVFTKDRLRTIAYSLITDLFLRILGVALLSGVGLLMLNSWRAPASRSGVKQVNLAIDQQEEKTLPIVLVQPKQEDTMIDPTSNMKLVSDPKELQTSSSVIAQAEESERDRTIGQYIDHGDGTITDTKTGLMWKRCPEGLSGDNCEDGKVEDYTWDDAMQRFKNVEFAGYADWRLPTIDELKTLVYCSKGKNKEGDCKNGSEAPAIIQQVFPNTEATWFWSGSPYAGNSGYAWYVNFDPGYSNVVNRYNDSNYAVRLVRDGQ
ncbi:MAG: DUF1566 domain-containing protein, partial [Candidatus Electrothrix sp. AR1]|nr:DUF1566 domain-containing protein [Candidatus Electrothrix sp. AR1]